MHHIEEIPIHQITIPEDRLNSTISDEQLTALTESIHTLGLINPVTLQAGPNGYILIAGRNRLEAFRRLGHTKVPSICRPAEPTHASALNIVENLNRGSTNPISEAYAIFTLMSNQQLTVPQCSALLGRPTSWIDGRLELLDLPQGLQEAIQNRDISVGVAKELSAIPSPQMMEYLTAQAIESGASAKTVHYWIKGLGDHALSTGPFSPTQTMPQNLPVGPIPLLNCFACGTPHQPANLRPELLCETCRKALQPTPPQPALPQPPTT